MFSPWEYRKSLSETYNLPSGLISRIPYRRHPAARQRMMAKLQALLAMNDILEKPRKIYVTRKIEFNAAHRLYNPELSEEENRELYGKCSGEYGHGHNYLLEITLSGMINRKTGYLFDLKNLKKILEEEIVARFDHRHLNHEVSALAGNVPTTEILAVVVWDILDTLLRSISNQEVRLHEVRIHETGKNSVTYLGE
jgi:6-pyruvoyltetrahydropterin/6-carboxytetrahydropterin synthase